MTEVCLICEKNKSGKKLEEGVIINSIRKIKRMFGIAKENKLVVCDMCMEEYQKRRKGFEKTILLWGALGAILGLLLIIPSILIGDLFGILRSIILAIILIVVLLALVGIVRYIPKLEGENKKTIIRKKSKTSSKRKKSKTSSKKKKSTKKKVSKK